MLFTRTFWLLPGALWPSPFGCAHQSHGMILLDALVGVHKDLLILSHGQLLVLVLEDVTHSIALVKVDQGDIRRGWILFGFNFLNNIAKKVFTWLENQLEGPIGSFQMIREVNQHHIQDRIALEVLGNWVVIKSLDTQRQERGLELLSLIVTTGSALLVPLVLSVQLISIEVVVGLMPHAPWV